MTIASSMHGGEMVAQVRLDDVRLVTHEVETHDLHGASVGHGFRSERRLADLGSRRAGRPKRRERMSPRGSAGARGAS